MRLLGAENILPTIFLFILIIYCYVGAESIRSDFDAAEDYDKASSAEFYETKRQKDHRTGMNKIIEFFTSMETFLEKMFKGLETVLSLFWKTNAEIKKENVANFTQKHVPQDCGGKLELAPGAPSTIHFPNLGNNQSCMWTIIPQGNLFASHRIKFQSLGAETEVVGVSVTYWYSSTKIKSKIVTDFGSWISIPAPYVLIIFCSDAGKVSSGFEASIVGLGIYFSDLLFLKADLKPSWFGNSTETLKFLCLENVFDRIASKTPLVGSTDCGGILNVERGVPSTIRYPNSGKYRSWEKCAWTIFPHTKFASYAIKIQSFGMHRYRDMVTIYFWTDNLELQSETITKFDSWISIPAPYVVITFCSNLINDGEGFGASIVGVGTSSESSTFTPIWLTNPRPVSFSYPSPDTSSTGSNNEMVFVVVQQPNRHNAIVSVSVPRIGNDTMKFYELGCRPDYSSIGLFGDRYGGGNSSWAMYHSSYNQHPYLVIFKSNSRKSGVRFTISY